MNLIFSIWGLRKFILIFQSLAFNAFYKKIFKFKVSIYGFPIVSIAKYSKVSVGKRLALISSSYFSETGINHPVIIRTLSPEARLRIGDDVGISGGGICVSKEVILGNNVLMGANAFITDTDFHPINPESRRYRKDNIFSKKVVIGDNVFIGMDSLILKGVTIGENSIIGASSVVTNDIPPNCIAAGIPAKVKKRVEESKLVDR